jgi:UTP:GlnB (protein PII) uridylyltransferase
MATAQRIKSLLAATTIPSLVIEELVETASSLWLMSAPAAVLAKDLVLCYPTLGENEVRAVAHPLDGGLIRLTVVARDRDGFLADTAAVLATEGVSVIAASAVTWTGVGMALHALTVRAGHLTESRWDELGARLRTVAAGEQISVDFAPAGRAVVVCSPPAGDRRVLSVSAEDQVGLLWAICRWLADHGLSIESAHIDEVDGRASDRFVILGDSDITGLRARLTSPSRSVIEQAADVVARTAGIPCRFVRRLLPR